MQMPSNRGREPYAVKEVKTMANAVPIVWDVPARRFCGRWRSNA